MTIYPIQQKQRDYFIDFLKGLCIICVVLTHNLPANIKNASVFVLWGSMSVPLFLMLQSYHVFKHGVVPQMKMSDYYKWGRLWTRILKPFALTTLISGIILIIAGHEPRSVIKDAVLSGGIGPGSYYVWIYLQFAILLPLCLTLINKWGGVTFILFVLISQCVEWLCMYISMPEHIYRLMCFRYLFLIYLGYVWTTNRMSKSISRNQIIISIGSALALLALYYTSGSLYPFLYDTNWRVFHWICYFWPSLLLPWFIWRLYDHIPGTIKCIIGELGRWSYQIFLMQMFVFTIYPHSILDTGNLYLNVTIFIVSSTVISIIPIIVYKRWQSQKNLSQHLHEH